MSTSRSVERSIIRQLLNRRAQPRVAASAESFITTLSIVACLGLLAVFVPGLLWVLLAGAVVLTLGS
jgi:fatty acid desaturase